MTLNQTRILKQHHAKYPYRNIDWANKSIYGQSTKRKTNWLKIIIEYIIVSVLVAFVFGYLAHIRTNSITEASNVSSNNVNWQAYIDAHRTR